jgi:methionine-rich copper-binding protein CopC
MGEAMKARHSLWGLFLLAVLSALVPLGLGARDTAVRHITMDGSLPADGEKASNVTEVRLFFSGAPLMRGASVRIVTSARTLVRSSPPAPDPTDPKQLFVTVDPALAPGAYVVQWRCIADDGHVMRGDFRFEVAAE